MSTARRARLLAPLLVCIGCSSCGGATAGPPVEGAGQGTTDEVSPEVESETDEETTMDDTDPGFAEPASLADVPAPTPAEAERFASAANALGLDIYEKLRANDGNLVFSPASIELAFAMTAAGARSATADEMNRVLHVGESPDTFHASAGRVLASTNRQRDAYELRVVNRLFGERTYAFEQPYLALTRDAYRAPLEPVDFRGAAEPARQRINAWVMDQTNDRIDELLPAASLDSLTRLVLVNAIYFMGKWRDPFTSDSTRPRAFYVNGREEASVPTMHQTARLRHAEVDGVQVLEMGYQGDDLAMMFLLPRARAGLGALEASLDSARLERYVGALAPTQVAVALPKFEIRDARIELPEVMQALGMRLAFDRNSADFTGIARPASPGDGLYVSDAFHEAFIRVDEEGTEAAAATAVVMTLRGGPVQPAATFTADHPFVFLIRDTRSGTVLFLGRLVDPRG